MAIISTTQDDNIGGLATLKFIPWYYLSSKQPLVIIAGFDWITVQCTSETMSFLEKTVIDENGTYIDTMISGAIPKIRPDVRDLLDTLRSHPVVVECQDQNGYTRRAGVSGRLVLADQSGTGAAAADTNGYRLQFSGKQLNSALFI